MTKYSGYKITATGMQNGLSWQPSSFECTYSSNDDESTYFKPVKIIINNRTTICYWQDGSKTTVACAEGEQQSIEAGVSACIVKHLYGNNRSAFLKDIESKVHKQTPKELKYGKKKIDGE